MFEGRKRWIFPAQEEREFVLSLPFCSIQALSGLDDATHVGEVRSLLSLLIQMLISPRNTLTDTPRNVLLLFTI